MPRAALAVARPDDERRCRHARVADRAAVRAGVRQAEQRERGRDHLVDVVEGAVGEVEQRQVQELLAAALEERVVDHLGRIRATGAGPGAERPVGVELVVDRVREREHHVEPARDLLEEAVRQAGDHRRVLLEDAAAALGVAERHDPLGEWEGRNLVEAGGEQERVRGGLEAEQHADRSGRDLGLHVEPVVAHLRHRVEDLPPAVGGVVRLLDGERDRLARRAGERLDELELAGREGVVGRLVGVGDQLGDAVPGLRGSRRRSRAARARSR